jgi:hypothetical protein
MIILVRRLKAAELQIYERFVFVLYLLRWCMQTYDMLLLVHKTRFLDICTVDLFENRFIVCQTERASLSTDSLTRTSVIKWFDLIFRSRTEYCQHTMNPNRTELLTFFYRTKIETHNLNYENFTYIVQHLMHLKIYSKL